MKTLGQLLRLVCVAMSICFAIGAQAASPLKLTLGSGALDAEVAATKGERAKGLMNRRGLPQDRGMLFVYPEPAYFCMWMKNTLIPLSVAFIDAQGQVINIADMTPQTETTHCTQRNATYALEVNQGWFAKHGVTQGTQVLGLEKSPKAEY